MQWPIEFTNWECKTVNDIDSIGDDCGFYIDMLEDEGINPPTTFEPVFPQGYWWVWGN